MTGAGELLPWRQLMRLGLGSLRLPPPVFWAMTPRELAASAGLSGRPKDFRRSDLARLMARFPDAAPTHPHARETVPDGRTR